MSQFKTSKYLLAALMMGSSFVPAFAQSSLGFRLPTASGNFLAGVAAFSDLNTQEATDLLLDASNLQWENVDVINRAFAALTANGQIDDAASMARHLLEMDQSNEMARLVVGVASLKERRYSSAYKELADLPIRTFVGVGSAMVAAWAKVAQDEMAPANEILAELDNLGLSNFLKFHRSLMLDEAGDKGAIPLMVEAYEREPFRAYHAEALIRQLANAGQFEDALKVLNGFEAQGLNQPNVLNLRSAIEQRRAPGRYADTISKGAAETFRTLGLSLVADGATDIAIMMLQLGLYLNPEADDIRLLIAQVYEQEDQIELANRLYEQVSRKSVFFSQATVLLADNLEYAGDRDEALRRLGNIVAVQPDNIDARAALADKYRAGEEWEEAITHYSAIIDQVPGDRPRDWLYYYVRGICNERAQHWEAAESDFLRALDLNPNQPQVLNYLGYSWVDRGENLDRALAMIEQAVRAAPEDGYIVDSLGWAFYKLGRYEEAVAVLEQAVQLSPTDPEINDHLGDAYWQAGRKREARFQWSIAVEVDTRGNVVERAQDKLDNGLADVGDAEAETDSQES